MSQGLRRKVGCVGLFVGCLVPLLGLVAQVSGDAQPDCGTAPITDWCPSVPSDWGAASQYTSCDQVTPVGTLTCGVNIIIKQRAAWTCGIDPRVTDTHCDGYIGLNGQPYHIVCATKFTCEWRSGVPGMSPPTCEKIGGLKHHSPFNGSFTTCNKKADPKQQP